MTDSSKQELVDLIDRRNAQVKRRNALIGEIDRLNTEIETFDRQIEFADAVRIADADQLSAE